MSRESFSARMLRLYAAWRRMCFAFLALAALGFFSLGNNRPIHESVDSGYWLSQLFSWRGDVALDRELGVEIVGFDRSMRREDYARPAKTEPMLKLIADAKGPVYDRALYAATLDRLVESGARQVVFDFVFAGPGPSESGDKAFAAAIARHRDKVVIGFNYDVTERPLPDGVHVEKTVITRDPLEALLPGADPNRVLGFVTVWPDSNSVISRMVGREDILTLHEPALSEKLKSFADLSLTARAAVKLGASVPGDNRARFINFAGPAGTFPMTPVQDLFTPDRWNGVLNHGARFKGRVVVVGPYSEIYYKDKFATPLGPMLGVEIQANALRTWLLSDWIREPVADGRAVALAAALLFTTFAVNARVRERRTGVRFAASLAIPFAYVIFAYGLFSRADAFLPVMPAAFSLALIVAYGVCDFLHSKYESLRIKGIFGTFLPRSVVNRLVETGEEPKLGGEEVSLTAFFSDVQSFSAFSEILTPEKLVEIMNEYLGAMTDILEDDGGTLDKYVGDALVAMFGAPLSVEKHEYRACACALRMQERLAALRAEWASQGDRWPAKVHAMRMRIGLNTGPAVVGLMGSERRRNYTMMGDTVNLAARCESGAKTAGVCILIAEDTAHAAMAAGGVRSILFRRIDKWRVKGRVRPVMLYEPVAFADAASADLRECVRLYEAALDRYFAGDFAAAGELFAQARKLEPLLPGRDAGVEYDPSGIMAARCALFLANPPPADWDGVCDMTHK